MKFVSRFQWKVNLTSSLCLLFTWLISDVCGNVAEDMFTYELKVLHQPSGKEMALQVLNLPSVEPMLRVVRDDLLNQGITHDDISLYIPPLFYAQEFVVPILDCPVPVASPCQPEGDLDSPAPVDQEFFLPIVNFPAPDVGPSLGNLDSSLAPVPVNGASLDQLGGDQQAFASGVGKPSSETSLNAKPGRTGCDICGALISTSNLARHKLLHSDEPRPFKCGSPCKTTASRRQLILDHQSTTACCKYIFISN